MCFYFIARSIEVLYKEKEYFIILAHNDVVKFVYDLQIKRKITPTNIQFYKIVFRFITTFKALTKESDLRDTSKHQGLRNQLATVLQAKGITDRKVLNAIRQIPRHLFIDSSFEDHAYKDKAFPIAAEQTISQPYTVAFQSQTLAIQPNDKVLEIGTGSGYQTAVLLELKAAVFSIERQQELFKKNVLVFTEIRLHT